MCSSSSVNEELFLIYSFTYPIKLHVHIFWALLFYISIWCVVGSVVVNLHWGWEVWGDLFLQEWFVLERLLDSYGRGNPFRFLLQMAWCFSIFYRWCKLYRWFVEGDCQDIVDWWEALQNIGFHWENFGIWNRICMRRHCG